MRARFCFGRKATAGAAASALVASVLAAIVIAAPSASAVPGPILARAAGNVTADALPTAQIDGVAWSQAILGDTVYVGGSFANARPAGVALNGVGSEARTNLMSYTLSTGVMTSWAPNVNGAIKAVTLSPDHSRLYIGGSFTTVNGATHNRIAAFDTATGALISTFAPNVDATVNAIAATDTTVYVGGLFSKGDGNARGRLAAFTAATGAVTTWNPNADYNVAAVLISPDGTRVYAGGAFQNVGGQAEYGLVATDATTGAVVNWPVNLTVQDAGQNAGITSLSTDGTNIYGTGYVFGAGGNLEGAFNANPTTGAINWIESCHGDTYDSYEMANTVYVVSHEHFCGDVGAFPQTSPTWTFQHTTAFTVQATGTLGHNPYGGYTDWFGTPSPSQLNWYPDMTVGSYTGQSQSAWTVTGNGQYLVEGGEFPTVNGAAQQGLVRFAVPAIAPNKQGPRVSGSNFVPNVVSLSPGVVRVSFPLNYDRDDKTLNYTVTRTLNGVKTTVYTLTADSEFWNRPNVGFTDTTVPPGSTVSYKLAAADDDLNTVTGNSASITLPIGTAAPLSQYAQDVEADGASHYWRFDESSGSTGYDWAGYDDLSVGSGVTDGATGAILASSDTAATFDSSAVDVNKANTGFAVDPTAISGPDTFTEEAWFQTTSSTGGKIVGFGDSSTGNSSNYDRHIYMDASGKVYFGVYTGNTVTIGTPTAYNDGHWHYVVASMDANGMTLYVDGKRIGRNAGVTAGQAYTGYWRIGGDSSWSGANYFNGAIDDVAIYPTAISLATVQKHFIDAGGSLPVAAPVPTDSYGQAVYASQPDLYYRLDDTTGTTAVDSSGNANNGVYNGGELLGVASPVSGLTGTAATFDGAAGTLASGAQVPAPSVYTEELWFNTSTHAGGKLIGFGNEQDGLSTNYDRHVYMDDDGQLEFGTYSGQENLATSPLTYNDGKWHYLVATQGSDGMKLYVDDALVATNPQAQAQANTGYWRIGGDADWGGDSPYFAGTIDEAAVYSTELTASQIAAHYNASPSTIVNHAPTAAFSATVTNLSASFDGTASTDSDGSIASYAWDFGDGQTGTGPAPTHTYAAAGPYSVSLVVTDNSAAPSPAVTHTVTTTEPPPVNVAPTAAFTSVTSNLSVSFDASASTDSDGSVVGYAWDFGDGSTGTGVTATHVYAAAGSYSVSLIVTDNSAASSAAVTHSVAPTAPPNVAPIAAFTVSVANLVATFNAASSGDPDGQIASYAWQFGDGATSSSMNPAHTYAAAGPHTVSLIVTDNRGATDIVTRTVTTTAPPLAKTGGRLVAVAPARLLDTRSGVGAVKAALGADRSVSVPVLGRGGVPSVGVSAVVLNVTVTAPSASGYVTVWASGRSRPAASNLNFVKGETVPNLVIAPVGADGRVELFNGSGGTVQLLADVSGYYTSGPAVAGGLVAVAPARLLDTRSGVGAVKAALGADRSVSVPV
ncbi:MAG: domain containing protein, partial [Frankiales bacterium]|nr:domain containing protein [Frankiales bacterium]